MRHHTEQKFGGGSFEDFINNIEYFYNNKGHGILTLKYSNNEADEEEKNIFYTIFQEKCDELFVETLLPSLWQDTNVSKKIKDLDVGLYGQEKSRKQVCPFLFTTLVINHKGEAHLCCADWKSQYILGDMTVATLKDIWEGEKLRHYQITHLKKEKDKIELCKNCESLDASTIDNIDDNASDILNLFYQKGRE